MKTLMFFFVLSLLSMNAFAKLVHYELVATKAPVNMSGKRTVDFALQVNGSIPAPTLEFTEGDDAEIVVKNRILDDEFSIHWHGILLPPEMDGVSNVTTAPILAGQDHVFRFKIRQHGTYWYHSHTNVQEQKGVYGAIVIHPRNDKIKTDREVVAVLSDWTDENPVDVLENLKKDGDYYLYKKKTMRSWLGAIEAGSFENYIYNEMTRMGGMDASDVGYDSFLINGKREHQLLDAKPGERIRLRIINAAASTYFHLALGNAPMKVIAVDGVDISPVNAKEILAAMAETYDVLVQVPQGKNLEFKATAQDGTGFASAWIGSSSGERVVAPEKAKPDLYAKMDHSEHAGHTGHTDHSAHSGHDMHHMHQMHGEEATPTVDNLTVDEVKANTVTEYSNVKKTTDVQLILDGDMRRYVWHINGKAIHQERNIEVSEGDLIRFTFINHTMMHHPMHLHGHFFRVLNKFGKESPLKHTVDVPPHGTRVIEFLANEPGEWMLHCHNLYHLKSGMARVVKYMSFTPSPEIAHHQKHDHHMHDHWYSTAKFEAATNHAQARMKTSSTWNEFLLRGEGRNSDGKNFSFKEDWELEGDALYRRWFNQYFNLSVGGTGYDKKLSGMAGFGYLLPFMVESNFYVTHLGKFRGDLSKRFQWTRVIFSDADLIWRPDQSRELGRDFEYEFSLMYGPSWSWAAGLMLTNRNIGAGIQVQF